MVIYNLVFTNPFKCRHRWFPPYCCFRERPFPSGKDYILHSRSGCKAAVNGPQFNLRSNRFRLALHIIHALEFPIMPTLKSLFQRCTKSTLHFIGVFTGYRSAGSCFDCTEQFLSAINDERPEFILPQQSVVDPMRLRIAVQISRRYRALFRVFQGRWMERHRLSPDCCLRRSASYSQCCSIWACHILPNAVILREDMMNIDFFIWVCWKVHFCTRNKITSMIL